MAKDVILRFWRKKHDFEPWKINRPIAGTGWGPRAERTGVGGRSVTISFSLQKHKITFHQNCNIMFSRQIYKVMSKPENHIVSLTQHMKSTYLHGPKWVWYSLNLVQFRFCPIMFKNRLSIWTSKSI